jgi:hypothetical protein
MNRGLRCAILVLLPLSCLLPSANALEPVDPFSYSVNGSPVGGGVMTFNPSTNLWSTDPIDGFNNTPLPAGTFFDFADPLSIDITLSNPITVGDNINYGFGLAGLDPVPSGGFLFDFSISLINDGTAIAAPFGFTLDNPFGFDVTDVGTGTSTTITGGTFNEIDVTVTAPFDLPDPPATSFSVNVGNNVPDNAMTLAELVFGLACIALVARFRVGLSRES